MSIVAACWCLLVVAAKQSRQAGHRVSHPSVHESINITNPNTYNISLQYTALHNLKSNELLNIGKIMRE